MMKKQNKNTAKYFAKRQEQNMKRQHDRATDKMKIINRDFDKSLSLLESDINKILGNVRGLTSQEVRARLNETISNDEYNKLLDLYRTTKDKEVKRQVQQQLKIEANKYRISRKEAIIDSINRERLRMTDSILNNTTDQLKKSITETASMFGGHFDNEMVESILNSRWLGGNYSSRIWNNQSLLANTLQSELMQSFIAGKTNKEIARVLEQYTDYGRHMANRLIRTETSYMVNKADLESSKQRGIKAKKFEANLDSRTSKICRENNQKIIPIDKIKVGENAPPLHPYCRSFLSDMLKGWDYETDEELDNMIGMKSNINPDLNRESKNLLARIGKNHSVNNIEKLKKVSTSDIINMNSIDEIKEYITSNYNIRIANFDELDVEKSKIIFSGIDDIIKKYPDIENFINTVIFDKTISHDGLVRGFNIHIGKTGFNYETITHELAHILDKVRSSDNLLDYSQEILKKARQKLKLRKNSKEYSNLAYKITGYDYRNAKLEEEIFAYSFETEITNSKLGNTLSKAIMEEIDVYKG